MFFGVISRFPANNWNGPPPRRIIGPTLLAMAAGICAWGDSVSTTSKQIIGATAKLTEVSTGISFSARIDTGAQSCSLHVKKIKIDDKSSTRTRNVGKTIRFLVRDEQGNEKWMEGKIDKAVRIKSPSLKSGEFDHRYKVLLTFEWNGVRKEVLVTLNDRTAMEYPLLIGRNFLQGDFLVDVDKNDG
ncbi:MAG: RimK/LysX family protein [Pirellulales bacterium]